MFKNIIKKVFILFILFSVVSFDNAINNDIIKNEIRNVSRKNSYSVNSIPEITETNYKVSIENPIVNYDENINIIIEEVETEYSFIPYITNSTFIVQHNVIVTDDYTILEIKNNHAAGEHSFDINISSSNNEILLNQTIYIYSDGINDYVSVACFEEARELFYCEEIADSEDLFLLGILDSSENINFTKTIYEAECEYLDFIYSSDDYSYDYTFSNDIDDNILRISGRVQWTDTWGEVHPLAYNRVSLVDDDIYLDDFLKTTYTDSNGCFEFEISEITWVLCGSDDLFVSIYPQNNAVTVSLGNKLIYPIKGNLISQVSDSNSICYDFLIYDTSLRTGAYEISQMMIYPYMYAKALSEISLLNIYVNYPSAIGTYYFPGHIGVERGYKHDWDSCAHEYGHYIVDSFNITELLPGNHWFNEDCAKYHDCREYGNRLAWSEGLATYIGLSALIYFNVDDLNIRYAGDSIYHMSDGINYNDFGEYYQIEYYQGEANEGAIAYFLLDLMDNDDSTNDNISFGHQQMWDLLTTRLNKNLCDFIELLDINTIDKKNEIGILEEYYGFSAKNLSSSELLNLAYSDNTFTWDSNIDSDSLSKLSYYDLVFYSVDLSQSYTIENISTTTYTLTSEDLENILLFNSHTIYWQVIGYNDRYGTFDEIGELLINPFTGGYISSLKEIAKPTVTSEIGLEGTYYGSLIANDCVWYKITAPVSGDFTFESTGDWDLDGELFGNIVINSSISGRIAYDSDSGADNNFKLSYYLNEGQVLYLRVKGANQYTSGSFNLEITIDHSHTYSYEPLNSSTHKGTCICGKTITQVHAVSPSGTSRYKPCIICGYIVDTGTNMGIVGPLSNKKYITSNGSYMLPNGVIVLKEEDLEAYLNETLVFEEVIVDDNVIA